jgi:phage baseplate assembly protein W
MVPDFLGKGFAYPLAVNTRGGIQQARDLDKVHQSILILLGTQYGERLMRPQFGCNLKSLVFAPNNLATANLAKHYVTEGLANGEPRIILDSVLVDNDNRHGRLVIHIRYRIRATYQPDDLVYPFYLQPTQL